MGDFLQPIRAFNPATWRGPRMKWTQDGWVPAERRLAVTALANKPSPRQPSQAELAKPYIAEFGEVKGSVYCARNLTMEQARAEFRREQHEAAQAEANERAAAGKPYLDAFGEIGGKYFSMGLTLEEAHAKHRETKMERLNSELGAEFAGKTTRARGSTTKAADATPAVDVKPDGKTIPFRARNGCGSDGAAKLAASLKLPKK
jgi:hypothetical protein